ncbi:one cut domain family member 3-like isoform X1 [Anopheles albimanus]|uniref:one cut domain family member 3-like isoform X1 n=1 Tax=Anopheles albimanus TaxID=7167 RepID=UPI00164071B3|nr:one cut domain family member 3-like isoform X1 [Anopheles albimanus]
MRAFIAIALLMLVQCVLTVPVPQFLTFRDGKFGVNFGGYHAEAGLGGLLTGNAAHGGLSASAGTPHGQQAGAGLGGIVGGNERTAGGAYAGATAGSGVGASAAIGGGLDGAGAAGGVGAESHAGGLSKKVVKLGQTNGAAPPTEVVISKQHGQGGNFERIDNREYHKEVHTEVKAPPPHPAPPQHGFHKTVYKKKVISHPHKVAVVQTSTHHDGAPSHGLDINRFFEFQTFSNLGAQFAHPPLPPPPPPPPAPAPIAYKTTIVKESSFAPVHYHQQQPSYEKEVHTRLDSSNGHSAGGASTSTHVVASSTHNSNFWNDIFNIPISTLSAVNQFLNNKSGSGSVHVEKHVSAH